MPTYTYRCQRCGEEFERFQSMSDEPVKRCPACKGKVQRTFHPVGIVLKGSGFHRNDYRAPAKAGSSEANDKSEKSDKGDKGDKSDKSDKSDKKSETKASEPGSSKSTDSKGSDPMPAETKSSKSTSKKE